MYVIEKDSSSTNTAINSPKMRKWGQGGRYADMKAMVLIVIKTSLCGLYECRIVGIYMGESLRHIRRRYEGGRGGMRKGCQE